MNLDHGPNAVMPPVAAGPRDNAVSLASRPCPAWTRPALPPDDSLPPTMTLETLLAALHITAILTLVVFVSSAAALCRPEWFNGPLLERLARVDMIYGISAVAVLATAEMP